MQDRLWCLNSLSKSLCSPTIAELQHDFTRPFFGPKVKASFDFARRSTNTWTELHRILTPLSALSPLLRVCRPLWPSLLLEVYDSLNECRVWTILEQFYVESSLCTVTFEPPCFLFNRICARIFSRHPSRLQTPSLFPTKGGEGQRMGGEENLEGLSFH